MKVFPVLALVVFAGCGVDPQPFCEGATVTCGEPGYVAVCSEPTANAAVNEAGGLFCTNNDGQDFGRTYIGPAVDEAPGCNAGAVMPCPDNSEPTCFFLIGCDGSEL